jgi:DNA replication protein DnaC
LFDIEVICPFCLQGSVAKSETEGNGFPKYGVCPDCKAHAKASWIRRIDAIGPEYERFTFSKYEAIGSMVKKLAMCKAFAERKVEQYGLWLFSEQAGNGKTHLAIATLKHWIELQQKLNFTNGLLTAPFEIISEPDLLLKIRSTFKSDSTLDEQDILEIYQQTEILVLDDIGKYSVSDLSFMQRVMFSIIDYRYTRHKLTVLTTNKNGAELQQYLGAYTFDRICGMTGNKMIEVVGESYRQRKAK